MSTATVMTPEQRPSAYDGIGRMYDLYWRGISGKLTPALDRLLLNSLPRGASVLDLCCGAGHLAAVMCRRGLAVTGLDGSEDMIRFARQNAPRAAFLVADARRFSPPRPFDAVISTGDSMNHMLSEPDLAATFHCVQAALAEGGRFVFDMNMTEAFETQWHKSSTVVGVDHLLYVRGKYDRARRIGTTELTIFDRKAGWTRLDLTLFQKCYRRSEVRKLLFDAGFTQVSAYPAKAVGIRGRLAAGRTFFVAFKAPNPSQVNDVHP